MTQIINPYLRYSGNIEVIHHMMRFFSKSVGIFRMAGNKGHSLSDSIYITYIYQQTIHMILYKLGGTTHTCRNTGNTYGHSLQ